MNKKSVINIKNEDDNWFEYSMIASQFYEQIDKNQSYRPEQYKQWLGTFNMTGCSTPMQVHDIGKFEKNNDLSINVYHINHNAKQINPLRLLKMKSNWKTRFFITD